MRVRVMLLLMPSGRVKDCRQKQSGNTWHVPVEQEIPFSNRVHKVALNAIAVIRPADGVW